MDHDLADCEICGEMFPSEALTKSFYWTVCDECKEDYEQQDDPPVDAPWRI